MYLALKHSHTLLAVLLIVFFTVRLYWKLTDNSKLQAKLITILSHISDTLLIVLGFTMVYLTQWSIQPWLIAKWIMLILYIVAAYYCLKKATTQAQILMFGSLALTSLVLAMFFAFSKSL